MNEHGTWSQPPATPPLPGRHATDAAFRANPRPHRINLRTGLYWPEARRVERPGFVVAAERALAMMSPSPDYLPLDGDPGLRAAVAGWVGGGAVLGTPGGTGAARLLCEVARGVQPGARVWLPEPGWPNHARIAKAAGLEVRRFRWLCETGRLDLESLLGDLAAARRGDLVVLHAALHNPTGVDPDRAGWDSLGRSASSGGWVPVLDAAFLGFSDTLEVELEGAMNLARAVETAVWTVSLGKTLGLYGERVGALVWQGRGADALGGHAMVAARALWSSPPAHGQRVAASVWSDPGLRGAWEQRLARVRTRLDVLRRDYVAAMEARELPVSGMTRHGRGLFVLSGASPEVVEALRRDEAIYLGPTGGLNLTVLDAARLQRLADAFARHH